MIAFPNVNAFVQSMGRLVLQERVAPMVTPFRGGPVPNDVPKRRQPFTVYDTVKLLGHDEANPMRVASLGQLQIEVDPNIIAPRIDVSPEFERLQTPSLVKSTRIWLLQFFGPRYPVHVYFDKIKLHPLAYMELLKTLGYSNQEGI